jgi:RNA polymerase sigma-70 factor (ECF subfamily)
MMLDELPDHVQSLRRYAYVLCRDHHDADDLVQESLTKAIAAAHSFQEGRDLRVWLFSILHNTFVSSKRQYAQRTRAAAFLDAMNGDQTATPEQEKRVEARHTVRMLSRLSPDQQAALSLVAVEGVSYDEAAQILDVPVGTLMSRLARGRERLRHLLNEKPPNRFKIVR